MNQQTELEMGIELWQKICDFKDLIYPGIIIAENEIAINSFLDSELISCDGNNYLITPPQCSEQDLIWLLCKHLELLDSNVNNYTFMELRNLLWEALDNMQEDNPILFLDNSEYLTPSALVELRDLSKRTEQSFILLTDSPEILSNLHVGKVNKYFTILFDAYTSEFSMRKCLEAFQNTLSSSDWEDSHHKQQIKTILDRFNA